MANGLPPFDEAHAWREIAPRRFCRHPIEVLRATLRRGPETTSEVCALGVAGYVARCRRDGVGGHEWRHGATGNAAQPLSDARTVRAVPLIGAIRL